MSEPEDSSDSFSAHLIENLFATWIDEELARRNKGQSRADVVRAVVELPPHAADAIIRLNDEARLQARVVVGAAIKKGDPVTAENIKDVESFKPVDVGPNSGWMAYAVIGDSEYAQFDFRYNKQRTAELLQLAQQYVWAVEAVQDGALRPAVDNLLSAAELTVQAQMLGEAQEVKVHNLRDKWLRDDERLGNAPTGFSAMLKRLRTQRAAARYGDGSLTMALDEVVELTARVREMITHAAERVGAELREVNKDSKS